MKSLFLILMFSGAVLAESPGFSKTGSDDFKVLARSGKIVDKTLLIKDVITQNDLVTLFTRPRRWGKSTSMNMLWRFFALEHDPIEARENRELFETLKIKNETTRDPATGDQVNIVDRFQGKCPSIFLSFKDVRAESFEELTVALKTVISAEFHRHDYLAVALEKKTHNKEISAYHREYAESNLKKFKRLSVAEGAAASKDDLKNSLQFLSHLLYQHYNKTKVCVFFDEYDAPLHMAFTQGYLLEGAEVIRNVFSPLLKGNTFAGNDVIERAFLTGILRLAKASLLSGVNNLFEDNVFNSHYASHYGFTENELTALFTIYDVERTDTDNFKKSYNGYNFYRGQNESTKVSIYNPWSVVSYLKDNTHQLLNHWTGTGGTELLDHLVIHPDLQDALATLRSGEPIHIKIPKDVTFSGLTDKPATLWPLLIHTGYLTLQRPPVYLQDTNEYEVDLVIPNTEVRSTYADFHNQWLKSNNLPGVSSIQHFNNLITAIVAKDFEKVSAWIKREKASGEPIDFTSKKWIFNPLQLAALSGNSQIFKVVYEHYPMLGNSLDSDKLNIGDYARLSNLKVTFPLRSSFFKEAVPFLEPFCFGATHTQYVLSAFLVGGGGYLMLHHARHLAARGAGVVVVVGGFITVFKDLGSSLLKKVFGATCDRYNRFHSAEPKDFTSLLQFGEYIVRNHGSYVSFTTCPNSDTLISRFEKVVTEVRHAETKPLTFFLCQPNTSSEM